MNFIALRRFIVGTILLLLISDINGAEVRRRRRQVNSGGKSDLDWQDVVNSIRKIPLFGPTLSGSLQNFGRTVHEIDELTNGALSRIAEGYPPCVIDLNGIHCNGEQKNGSIRGIAKDLINGTKLPDLVKIMVIDFLNTAVFPLFDSFVGARASSEKKT